MGRRSNLRARTIDSAGILRTQTSFTRAVRGGASASVAALVSVGALSGCHHEAPAARIPPLEVSSPKVASPVTSNEGATTRPARWVLVPERGLPATQHRSRLGTDSLILDGVRLQSQLQGAPTQSLDFLPGSNVDGLPLPAALDSGFLFHSDLEAETVFWRADSWTAPVMPLTRLPERADRIEIGFGRVYARLADSGDTVAFDPSTGKSINLGPLPPSPSYFDFQFWDDWFAVVHADARGVLATFDGGVTWHATGVTDEEATLDLDPGGVVVSTTDMRDLLTPNGAWRHDYEQVEDEAEGTVGLPSESLGRNPLELAVMHGLPISPDEALVAKWGHVGLVDLNTGKATRVERDQYPGSEACHAVALGAPPSTHSRTDRKTQSHGVGLVCLLTNGETVVYRVDSKLELEQYAGWNTHVKLWSSNNGNLVAQGACAGVASPGSRPGTDFCVLRGTSPPQTVHVKEATGALRVVALSDLRVALLLPPRPGSPGYLQLTTASTDAGPLVPSSTTSLHFAKDTPEKLRTIAETGLWLVDGGELADGRLGYWVATANRLIGLWVALDGTIEVSTRTEADLRRTHISGPRAVELSSGETAWQSLDYGQNWREMSVPRGLTAASTRDTRDVVGCSAVGCSFGNWLRVGYGLDGQNVPTQASEPEPLKFRSSAYSQWNLHCYPTGNSEGPKKGSATAVFATGNGRPRYGSSNGFMGSALPNSSSADIASSANRPFLGVPKPTVPRGSLAFDMGADGSHQFRSYAWGSDGDGWRSSSAWLTRVADRFAVSGLWSTAPTRGPWPNALTAAQLFGADRANRYSSSWQVSLDPEERGGVLRVTTTGTTELHFIEEGSATVSIGNTSFGPISGVVKVHKTWYFGSQEGNRFHVYRVRNSAIDEFADFPIGDPVAPMLTRNTRGTALAIQLRAPAGTWHVYPLTETGQAEPPIVLSRDTLNTEWPRCDGDQLGFYGIGALPLSRFTPNDGSDVLLFEGVPSDWKAEAATARTIVSHSSHCVEALAARLAGNQEAVVLSSLVPPKSGAIPLTVTDRLNDVRYGFQCLP